jgi:hypothetical protein
MKLQGCDTPADVAGIHLFAYEGANAAGHQNNQQEHARKGYNNYLLCSGPLSAYTVLCKQRMESPDNFLPLLPTGPVYAFI